MQKHEYLPTAPTWRHDLRVKLGVREAAYAFGLLTNGLEFAPCPFYQGGSAHGQCFVRPGDERHLTDAWWCSGFADPVHGLDSPAFTLHGDVVDLVAAWLTGFTPRGPRTYEACTAAERRMVRQQCSELAAAAPRWKD